MNDEIRNKIERWKLKAELFLEKNIKAFIVDIKNTYYWCDIIFVGENKITIQPFRNGKQLEKKLLFWVDIIEFEEYEIEKWKKTNYGTQGNTL